MMTTPSEPETFEAALAELESIVGLLEQGQQPLKESLAIFGKGVALLRFCRTELETAETRIRELVEIDSNGNARLRDFEHEATVPKRQESSHKTSPPAASEASNDDPNLLF